MSFIESNITEPMFPGAMLSCSDAKGGRLALPQNPAGGAANQGGPKP